MYLNKILENTIENMRNNTDVQIGAFSLVAKK